MLCTKVDPRFAEAGGRVGLAETGERRSLMVSSGYVPVIVSIGLDAEGGLLNINADDAAAVSRRRCGLQRSCLFGCLGCDGRFGQRHRAHRRR